MLATTLNKPIAKICTVCGLSSAHTFVLPSSVQGGLREGEVCAGRWADEAPEERTFQPSYHDVQGSGLDNTYAVEIISTGSIFLTGMRKWMERCEGGEGKRHEEGGRRREDWRRAKVKQKGKSEKRGCQGKNKERWQGEGAMVEGPTPRERLRHIMESHSTSQKQSEHDLSRINILPIKRFTAHYPIHKTKITTTPGQNEKHYFYSSYYLNSFLYLSDY